MVCVRGTRDPGMIRKQKVVEICAAATSSSAYESRRAFAYVGAGACRLADEEEEERKAFQLALG